MSGKDDEGPMKGRSATRLFLLLTSVLSSLAILAGYACASTGEPPSIEAESATNITPTSATLNADINLHEAPAGVYYQFQVVNDPSEYAPEIVCPPEPTSGPFHPCIGAHSDDALPIGFLPGNTLQPGATLGASLDLASAGVTLHPGTTYHYRVLVARAVQSEDTIEWEPPTVMGADQTFTTPEEEPPSIEAESATNITPTSATLNADINLHEAPAGVYYQFQVVNDPSEYAPEIVCPPEPTSGPFHPCIGAHSDDALPIGFLPGNTLQPGATLGASLDLASAGVTLHPGTTYHYRVLVARAVQSEDTIEWEPPTVMGADQTFTTLPSPPPATNPDPQGVGVSQSAVQPPSRVVRRHHHRRHRKHSRRGLHRSKVSQARRAG
jgi:hypothetical protein